MDQIHSGWYGLKHQLSLASTSAKPTAVQTRPPIAKKVLDDPPAKTKRPLCAGFKGTQS
jgi:hypothetical protein